MVFCVILGIILNSFFESQTFSPSTHEEWQLGCRLFSFFFFFFPTAESLDRESIEMSFPVLVIKVLMEK